MNADPTHLRLCDLKPAESAVIVKVPTQLDSRFFEMGLIPGSKVTLLVESPFFLDPIAIEVRGGWIALRRNEAAEILIERLPDDRTS